MIETVNFTVKIKDIDVFKLKKLLSEFTDVVEKMQSLICYSLNSY